MYHIECSQMTMNPADWRNSQEFLKPTIFPQVIEQLYTPAASKLSNTIEYDMFTGLSHRSSSKPDLFVEGKYAMLSPCRRACSSLAYRPWNSTTVDSSHLFTWDYCLQYILGDSSEHLVIILYHSVYVLRNINWDSGLQTVYIERIPAVNERFWNGQNSLYPSYISLRTFTAADMEKN